MEILSYQVLEKIETGKEEICILNIVGKKDCKFNFVSDQDFKVSS